MIEINSLLIICAIIILFCVFRGAKKGILGIVLGVFAWIILFYFVKFSQPYIYDFLTEKTKVYDFVYNQVEAKVEDKYETEGITIFDEAEYSGLPGIVANGIEEITMSARDYLIKTTTDRITDITMSGIVVLLSIITGAVALVLLNCLIELLVKLPGIGSSNRLLGMLFGLGESIIILWIIFYIGICFPTTVLGNYIASKSVDHAILHYLYDSVCMALNR